MNYSAVKHYFFTWISNLDESNLSSTDKKFLNLLINNLETIIPLGTGGGLRAIKIGELIEQNKDILSSELPDFNIQNIIDLEMSKSISELVIGPFRGFTREETFTFDKKYTFMYGPNGSGKSSFCEGLEYALLGYIEESESKRIDISQYTKNAVVGIGKMPTVYGLKSNNQKFKIEPNPTAFKFCFIEKNRIDGFSRISANPAKTQQDRIATLFGLNSFNEFIRGFTDNMDGRYITLVNQQEIDFNLQNQKIIQHKARITDIDNILKQQSFKVEELLKDVVEKDINSIEDLKLYLIGEDGTKGKINQLQELRVSNIPPNMDVTVLDNVINIVNSLKTIITSLIEKVTELEQSSSELNFKDLYTSIENISKNSKIDISACPACKTPIDKVIINPFSNATFELSKMVRLTELQDEIENIRTLISQNIKDANKNIDKLNLYKNTLNNKEVIIEQFTDHLSPLHAKSRKLIDTLTTELNQIEELIKYNSDLPNYIHEYNLSLDKKRKEKELINKELSVMQMFKQRLDEITALITTLNNEKSYLQKLIQDFTDQNRKRLKEISELNEQIKIHKEFIRSYQILIENLKKYINILTSQLTTGLSEKAREFYNIINSHDPEFERLEYLKLPTSAGEKITIRFYGDESEHDALLILSEGHIKILGLSILLSKVVNDNLNFIIFDDIVNAIDDDHRDGISELLMTNPNLNNRQYIITCHGDIFINKLEHKLGASSASKEVKNYRFIPSDLIEERGVKISIGNSKHYLLLAKKAFIEDSRKEAASRCRQAIESISEQLWNKLSKKLNISLTVKMRHPGMRPDLSTVVDSLIKELKNIPDVNELQSELKQLKEKYNWCLLNKGTHEQGDLPEIERKDISELLALVESIDVKTTNFKIEVSSNLKVINTVDHTSEERIKNAQ